MSTSLAPTRSTTVRNVRPVVIFVLALAVIVAVSLVLLFTNRETTDPLSTGSAEPDGTRALARLLEDQGIGVRETRSPRAATEQVTANSTLVIADTTFLTKDAARSIARTRADVVLLDPLPARLADIAPDVRPGAYSSEPVVSPGCALPTARRAGRADVGRSPTYRTANGTDATSCYRTDDGAHLVQTRTRGRTVTAVASSFPFQNGGLARQGNAALALNLLGRHDDLVWLIPDAESAGGEPTGSLTGLTPHPARVAAFGVMVAAALFAVARARRLGPVVAERLPVVVRATETTEGRARLYRSLRARERAADALRRGALARLRPSLQLPRDATPDVVVAAVTGRVGRDQAAVAALLYGGVPPDDAALVRLADELDTLEEEVRRS